MISTRQKTHNMEESIVLIRESLLNIETEIKDFKKALEKIQNLELEVEKYKETVNFVSAQYDTLLQKNHEYENKIKLLGNEVASLKAIKQDKEDIEHKYSDLEQYQRNRNVEIHGINEHLGEDCAMLVQKIAEEIEMDISKSDVDIAHRVKRRNSALPHPVIVQFKTRQKRDLFLKVKSFVIVNQNIPCTNIGKRVFINENLTSYNKHLLHLAKEKAKELNYRFTWFKNGKIRMRLAEQSTPIVISRKEDLLLLSKTQENINVANNRKEK